MATLIRAHDLRQFNIVQELLAVEGLHVAITSADRSKLGDYAGELARVLAGRYGLQVEAYRPGQLETLVADLILHRFDGALTGISHTSGSGRSRAGKQGAACVLFIPDAQAVRLREFSQLAKLAAGMPQLRLVVMFSGALPIEQDARLHALEARMARWDLDEDDAPPRSAAPAALQPSNRGVRTPAPKLASLAKPWITAAAATVAATAATSAALLIALGPAPTMPVRPANMAAPLQTPAPVRLQSLQLAGEPMPPSRRMAITPPNLETRATGENSAGTPDITAEGRAVPRDHPVGSDR